jgi:ADP-heptose:LPS heptosyltransferase
MHESDKADRHPWINPVGSMGDALMLSGVLKMVHEDNSRRRFNLIRRTAYQDILRGHPAIADIGYLPENAEMKHMTY